MVCPVADTGEWSCIPAAPEFYQSCRSHIFRTFICEIAVKLTVGYADVFSTPTTGSASKLQCGSPLILYLH